MGFDSYLQYDTDLDADGLQNLTSKLAKSARVFGIALYGTIPEQTNRISDYDLVIVNDDYDLSINKMITSVDERITDVMFIHLDDLKETLITPLPVAERSKAGFVIKHLVGAHFIYDPDRLLQQLQTKIDNEPNWLRYDLEALYQDWYWLNHQLYHIKRISQSNDATYLLSVQLKMCKNIGSIYQSYFKVRHQPWYGEKSALKYWAEYDKTFYNAILGFLQESSIKPQVTLYAKMIEIALQPVGGLWSPKVTAIILDGHIQNAEKIRQVYDLWLNMRGTQKENT